MIKDTLKTFGYGLFAITSSILTLSTIGWFSYHKLNFHPAWENVWFGDYFLMGFMLLFLIAGLGIPALLIVYRIGKIFVDLERSEPPKKKDVKPHGMGETIL